MKIDERNAKEGIQVTWSFLVYILRDDFCVRGETNIVLTVMWLLFLEK